MCVERKGTEELSYKILKFSHTHTKNKEFVSNTKKKFSSVFIKPIRDTFHSIYFQKQIHLVLIKSAIHNHSKWLK